MICSACHCRQRGKIMEKKIQITQPEKFLQKVKIITFREYEIETNKDHTDQIIEAIKNDGFENDDFQFVILD